MFVRAQMGMFAEQQSSVTIYHLPMKENKPLFPFPFAANKRKFAVSIFRCRQ
jgi:hypothetical protein